MAQLDALSLLDLPDGGVLLTRVTGFEQGEALIKPSSAPQGKLVPAVRIMVPPADKPTLPYYWDITAKTVQATLLGLLPNVIANGLWLRLQKFGVAPRARFTISTMPAGFTGPAQYGAPTP